MSSSWDQVASVVIERSLYGDETACQKFACLSHCKSVGHRKVVNHRHLPAKRALVSSRLVRVSCIAPSSCGIPMLPYCCFLISSCRIIWLNISLSHMPFAMLPLEGFLLSSCPHFFFIVFSSCSSSRASVSSSCQAL